MGAKPDAVGDLPTFAFAFTAPDTAPAATVAVGDVQVIVKRPDGTEVNDSAGVAATATPNTFTYTATDRIAQSGQWRWRINANAGLIDSFDLVVTIPATAFTTPLP